MPIILASQSPRRKDLLLRIGLEFDVVPSNVNEPVIEAGEGPSDYTVRLAKLKAEDVFNKRKKRNVCVIAADTVVFIDNRPIGKPSSRDEAFSMLSLLSGRGHEVFTGVYIAANVEDTPKSRSFCARSQVVINSLNPQMIWAYIETKEPFDKAGAYAVQGIGAFMVKEIHGSYTNVIGLPMTELIEVLLDLWAIGLR